MAAYLRDECGVGQGDRVAICAANGPGWLLTMWACASLGAVVVAMNGWWTDFEMRHALDLTEPSLLLIDQKRAARLGATPGLEQLDIDGDLDAMIAHDPTAELSTEPLDEDDPAILVFTSGTTGRPKAAVLTHRIVIAFCMEQMFIGAAAGRTGPGSGPFRASGATLGLPALSHLRSRAPVTSVISGITTVWPLGRFDAGAVIELTVRERINVWTGTATHLLRLLDHPDLPLRRCPAARADQHGRLGDDTGHPAPLGRAVPAPAGHDVVRLRLDRDRWPGLVRAELDARRGAGLRRPAAPHCRGANHRRDGAGSCRRARRVTSACAARS